MLQRCLVTPALRITMADFSVRDGKPSSPPPKKKATEKQKNYKIDVVFRDFDDNIGLS